MIVIQHITHKKHPYIGMKRKKTAQEAMTRIAAECALREIAPADAHDKCLRWGLTYRQANEVVEQLVNENFISEDRYARAYVHDKFLFNGWGRIKLRYMLRNRDIDPEVIDDALDEIADDDYEERLYDILRQKLRTSRETDAYKLKAALIRFASARGFESDMVWTAVDDLLSDWDNEEDDQ